MKIIALERKKQLDVIAQSATASIIFKHNTTCPISKSAKIEFEKNEEKIPADAEMFLLDLLSYRDISDAIAEKFSVRHESPQVLLIKNGECSYSASLYEISAQAVAEAMETE